MSERQQQIYNFIKTHIVEKQYPPTVREITTAVRLKSSSTTHRHLVELRKKGYIDFVATLPRTISITG